RDAPWTTTVLCFHALRRGLQTGHRAARRRTEGVSGRPRRTVGGGLRPVGETPRGPACGCGGGVRAAHRFRGRSGADPRGAPARLEVQPTPDVRKGVVPGRPAW